MASSLIQHNLAAKHPYDQATVCLYSFCWPSAAHSTLARCCRGVSLCKLPANVDLDNIQLTTVAAT